MKRTKKTKKFRNYSYEKFLKELFLESRNFHVKFEFIRKIFVFA